MDRRDGRSACSVGGALGDPARLGLDAVFPAFYLSLLVEEARSRRAVAAALRGAPSPVALMPVAPAGVPSSPARRPRSSVCGAR